jgi:hypothetical protein
MLAKSRYGQDLREDAARQFLAHGDDMSNAGVALAETIRWQMIETEDNAGLVKASESFVEMIGGSEQKSKCEGILGLMYLFFMLRCNSDGTKACSEVLRCTGSMLVTILNSGQLPEQFAASWALVWLGACRVWLLPTEPDVLGSLFRQWQKNTNDTVRRIALWAIASQSVVSRNAVQHCSTVSLEEFRCLLDKFDEFNIVYEKVAVLIIAWYLRALCDKELIERARGLLGHKKKSRNLEVNDGSRALYELLVLLGEKADQAIFKPQSEREDA